MAHTTRQGEEQYTLRKGRHIRFRLLGHRPVMWLNAARQDVTMSLDIGSEQTKVGAVATLAGIGHELAPSAAIRLYEEMRPQIPSSSQQGNCPSVVASRQLNSAEPSLTAALCEIMADAGYDKVHAVASDSETLTASVQARTEKSLGMLGFKLTSLTIISRSSRVVLGASSSIMHCTPTISESKKRSTPNIGALRRRSIWLTPLRWPRTRTLSSRQS